MKPWARVLVVLLLGLVIGVAAAAGAWAVLGNAWDWPPKALQQAWALGAMALGLAVWGVAVHLVQSLQSRRQMAEQTRRAQVAELTQQMVLTLSPRGEVQWANTALTRRTDRQGGHVIGRDVAQVLGIAKGEALTQLEKAIANGQALDIRVQGSDWHGHPMPLQVELQPLRDAKAELTGVVVIALDASAQQLADERYAALQAAEEAELAALYAAQDAQRVSMQNEMAKMDSEREQFRDDHDRAMAEHAALRSQLSGNQDALERLSSALEGANIGAWTCDLADQRVQVNSPGVHLLGRALGAELSLRGWIAQVHPEDLAIAREQVAPLLAGATNHFELDLRVRHGDGHWMPVLLRGGVALTGPDGEPERVAGTVQAQMQALQAAVSQVALLAEAEGLHRTAAFRLAEPDLNLEASPQLMELLGLAVNAPAPDWGQLLNYAADEEHRHAWQAALDEALASTEPVGWDLTLPLRSALGHVQWVRCLAEARDDNGYGGGRHWIGVLQPVPVPMPTRTESPAPRSAPVLVDVIEVGTPKLPAFDRIDVAVPDPEPPPEPEVDIETDLAVAEVYAESAPPKGPHAALHRHFEGNTAAYAQASRLLSPMLLNLPVQMRQAQGPQAQRALLRRVELLSRSLGASGLADQMRACSDDLSTEAIAALNAEILEVVDALQSVK